MEILKHYQKTVQSFPNAKNLFRRYNKTLIVLTKYELVHHRAWLKLIEIGHKSLQVKFLIPPKLYFNHVF